MKYLTYTLVFLTALLLSACSDSPFNPVGNEKPPTPPANGPATFGLVEVTISGIGTDNMSAYARPAHRDVAFDLSAPSNNAALSLDGSGGYVTADGVSDDLAAASDFTIEAWVYPEAATGSQQALFGFQTPGGGNLNILFYSPDTDQFSYYDPDNSNVFASGTYNPGQWVHIAVAIDNTGGGTLYINGQSKATFTTTLAPEAGGKFSIGQEWDGLTASNFFFGRIGELRIWNSVRTQVEIQTYMNSQVAPSTAGLVSYYRFNEGSGTMSADLAGNNDGVFQGDAGWGIGPELAGVTPADGTIQMEPVSNGSFTYGVRGSGGMRYLYATFKVRNAESDGTPYPTPRQNLTFLAVDTDASFGENQTYGITAVSMLRLFDGTELTGTAAQTIAKAAVPTGAVYQQSGGQLLPIEPDVLQVFTEAEAAAVTVTAGVEVFPYGFMTRSPNTTPGSRALPANPGTSRFDGRVTFAFKIPLQAQANQDPFEISAMFLPVDDSETRITQSVEEQTKRGNAVLAARMAALNPDAITILPGSFYIGEGTSLRCGPVRVAGPEGTPVTVLFPEPPTVTSLTPAPNSAGMHAIPSPVQFKATFSSSINAAHVKSYTFVVHGQQSGRQFVNRAYSVSGAVATAPSGSFFAGEMVEVSLTAGLGICPGRVVRYRAAATAGTGSFGAAATFTAGKTPVSVALGDLNGDGFLDMVTAESFANNVRVRLGDGAGGFGGVATFSVGMARNRWRWVI